MAEDEATKTEEEERENEETKGESQTDQHEGADGGVKSDSQKAEETKQAFEQGEQKVKDLEDDPPKSLEDWPDDQGKYATFGGEEGEHGYDEGPEHNLGPSGLRHHEDGTVEIDGEVVDNPEDYKGEPIPGGPTDPEARGPGSGGDDRADAGSDDEDDGERSGKDED